MRTTMLTLALSVALLAALAPSASASHMGPCTHEYAEIVLYGVLNYKNGGLKTIAPGVVACATGSVDDVIGDHLVLP